MQNAPEFAPMSKTTPLGSTSRSINRRSFFVGIIPCASQNSPNVSKPASRPPPASSTYRDRLEHQRIHGNHIAGVMNKVEEFLQSCCGKIGRASCRERV